MRIVDVSTSPRLIWDVGAACGSDDLAHAPLGRSEKVQDDTVLYDLVSHGSQFFGFAIPQSVVVVDKVEEGIPVDLDVDSNLTDSHPWEQALE